MATRKSPNRDGELLVVSRDLCRAAAVPQISPTLQAAIEDWTSTAPRLQRVYDALNANECPYAFAFDTTRAAAPLPRAYQWLDASAFANHGQLMITAFGIAPAPGNDHIPLMYQGGSDDFLGAHDDIALPSEADGIDFEGEIAVVLDDVPLGVAAHDAGRHIRLLMLVNDVSLRSIGPREMATGFGFLQAKPSSSFSPVAVTPDELGAAWDGNRLHLPVRISWNGERFGEPNAREMTFSFPELIAHAARTRRLRAGTILGSGTVSNQDRAAGSACISERRAIEVIDTGAIQTSFMRFGDRIRMEMLDASGASVFGAIEQVVRRA
nr:fumarylacetoacetate hydrolase family protein [Pandoraea sp. LA3]